MYVRKRGLFWTVVLVFASLIIPIVAAENGCFTEPSYVALNGCGFIAEATAVSLCDVQADSSTCLNKYFIRESSGISSCGDVAICDFNPGTWCGDSCEQVNYKAACEVRSAWNDQTNAPSQCVEGCCVCATGIGGICNPDDPFLNQNSCTAFCADNFGSTVALFDTSLGVDECRTTCGNLVFVFGTIEGEITDNSGSPIENVEVSVFGVSTLTDVVGAYKIENLPLGDVTIVATHVLFQQSRVRVTLASEDPEQVDFVLSPSQTGVVKGVVRDAGGNALSGVRVTATGTATDQITTNPAGEYQISGLPFGNYAVEADSSGYQAQRKNILINSADSLVQADFTLILQDEGTITGQILDKATGDAISFARVHINGAFVRHSGADGTFDIDLEANPNSGIFYEVTVTHPDYKSGGPSGVTLITGVTEVINFELEPTVRECVYPDNKPVVNFAVHHELGEQAVKLTWENPCRETTGYLIERRVAGGVSGQLAFIDIVPDVIEVTSYLDEDVEWDTSYEYSIVAVYTDVVPRSSEKRTVAITTGDVRCDGKYSGFEAIEFCDVETGRLRLMCDNQNQVIEAISAGPADCSDLGETFFCAGPFGADTVCKDTGVCSSQFQQANPFGLWFLSNSCYGQFDNTLGIFENFCTYDRTDTIFDACISCESVDSCFDYKGKEACEINNCGGGLIGECQWLDASEDFGTGYCVDVDAEEKFGTGFCGLCGPTSESSLFENSFCTNEICTSLGACYANADQTACTSCIEGESSCYEFTSELECNGGNNAHFEFDALDPSLDSCSLGRCSWDSSRNLCFKDGDGNTIDDCENIAGSAAKCKKDNIPPITTIIPEIVLVGDIEQELTFVTDGSSAPGKLYYCVDRTNTCSPNIASFKSYGGDATARLDFGEAGLLNTYAPDDHQYFIRYYSEDLFFNREDIRSKSFVADLNDPQITLNYSISLDPSGSDLTFTVILDEPAVCRDKLTQYGSGHAPLAKLPVHRNTSWVVAYPNQPDGLYKYTIECSDDLSNRANKTLNAIEIDALNAIDIISPELVVVEETFSFVVETSDASDCELFDGDVRVESMRSSDHLTHESTFRTFTANVYHSTWRVLCKELSGGEQHSKLVPFTVDKEPPLTTIELTSEDGLVQEHSGSGWVATMTSDVTIAPLCEDFPQEAGEEVGFKCAETLYCLNSSGGECIPTVETPLVTVTNDTSICFHSTDAGGNSEIRGKCGTILINPSFGIEIVEPTHGVSNTPEFDLQIRTKVPSTECKWAGASPVAFNFTRLITDVNIFDNVNPFSFEIDNFHNLTSFEFKDERLQQIMIMCQSATGVISPPQTFAIGYDTSSPEILSARASPALVTEGNTVDFLVETDDPTICTYGQKSTPLELTSKFPGYGDNIFLKEHQLTLDLTTEHDKKSHFFNVSCENQGGNVSDVEAISFQVDFSVAGTILELKPSGTTANTSVVLAARTSKSARCEFTIGSDDTLDVYGAFDLTGGTVHTQFQDDLVEGAYSYPIRCSFTTPIVTRQGMINFIVDRTPPRIELVNDGEYSCSLESVSPTINSTDNASGIVSYTYELFEKSTNKHIANGTIDAADPQIDDLLLNESTEYFFRMKAIDGAGLVSNEVSSDGFIVLLPNATECKERDAPILSIVDDTVRTGVSVTLNCRDETQCALLMYGLSDTKNGCDPDTAYIAPVVVTEDQFFCAVAEDSAGNGILASEEITVPDDDDDGITNPFDKCVDTLSGETVDNDGCSASQTFVDTDGDGLDDDWELRYDAADCPLDPHESDSDVNGVEDGDEDYDEDGVLNLDEYVGRTNPCLKLDRRQDTTSDDRVDRRDALSTTQQEKTSVLAFILLIVGVLMFLGGVGYLIYVSQMMKKPPIEPVEHVQSQTLAAPSRPPQPKVSQRMQHLRAVGKQKREARHRSEKEKRSALFSVFGSGEDETKRAPLPATLSKTVRSKKSAHEKLAGISHVYKKNKKGIHASLEPGEKSAFKQLEKLTHKAQSKKDIKAQLKNVSDDKARDVLDELKEIISTHKKGSGKSRKKK